MASKILPRSYYESEDVVGLSQALLGKVLVTQIGKEQTSGIIVETEAYMGPEDKASHAYNNRCTERTKTMFLSGGISYIYLCYGIHHLFNIVTNREGIPHAILVRAIQPLEGMSIMQKRRKMDKVDQRLSSGPGKLTKALGITTSHDALPLNKSPIWIEDKGNLLEPFKICAGPRVGIDYAQEYKDKNWRFWVKHNPWVSK